MKTADFLSAKSFSACVDRRRTPRRLAIVFAFGLLCISASAAARYEANRQGAKAKLATMPDEAVRSAQTQLQGIYGEMTQAADRLDPLAEHLRLPTLGWILAGLHQAAGKRAELEQIQWRHQIQKDRLKGVTKYELIMEVNSIVFGDELVDTLKQKLQEFTQFADAERIGAEVVRDRRDAMRLHVVLVDPLELPKAYRQKGKK
ncbi:MAG: hypothetical protein DWQ01_19985 [Planctomycetota bacterium]|nr:MAG: hypothetical protein DWQ01_19985 [Planctomycetota bacterium]